MKAENTTTGHNRTIKLTDIPDPNGKGILPELTITVMYTYGFNDADKVIDRAVTLDSVVIPEIIRAINNCGAMDEVVCGMNKDYSRAGQIFDSAVDGLKEYYPELKNKANVATIKAVIVVPDTGDDQADYEAVRDGVERQVQNLLMDRRTM